MKKIALVVLLVGILAGLSYAQNWLSPTRYFFDLAAITKGNNPPQYADSARAAANAWKLGGFLWNLYLRSDRRDTFKVLAGDTVITVWIQGGGRVDSTKFLWHGGLAKYFPGDSFLVATRRDTFKVLKGDTIEAHLIGGSSGSSSRADSLGPLSPWYRAYLSASGPVLVFIDSLGNRVDSLARVKWVRGHKADSSGRADTLRTAGATGKVYTTGTGTVVVGQLGVNRIPEVWCPFSVDGISSFYGNLYLQWNKIEWGTSGIFIDGAGLHMNSDITKNTDIYTGINVQISRSQWAGIFRNDQGNALKVYGNLVDTAGSIRVKTGTDSSIISGAYVYTKRCSTVVGEADTNITRKKALFVSATLTPACTSWVTNTYAYLCTLDAHVTVSHSPQRLLTNREIWGDTLITLNNGPQGQFGARLIWGKGWEYGWPQTIATSSADLGPLYARLDSTERKLNLTRRDLAREVKKRKDLETIYGKGK